MLTFGFLSELPPLVAGGVRVGIILVMALVIVLVARQMIPRLLRAHIPRIRKERPEQLAERSKTLSRVVVQVISVVVFIMAFIMILSVWEWILHPCWLLLV